MKVIFLLTLILISAYIFSDALFLEGDDFGICETRDGYIDLYRIDEDDNKTSVLDSGLYLNSRMIQRKS